MLKISFLIPSKNRLFLLKHAVNSIIRLNPKIQYEVIIVDNASDEDYKSYIDALNLPQIKYYRQSIPVPVTENWQKALSMADGDYVLMLGDDDALAPNFFDLIPELIDQHHSDVIYLAGYHYCYPNVMPDNALGYMACVKSEILKGVEKPYKLDITYARALAADILDFRHRFNFNAQHFLLNRNFIDQFDFLGGLYQSPYPDFFAAALLFTKAESILVVPEGSVIIGISPRSFGAYYFSNRQKEGYKFLDNETLSPDIKDFVKENYFPGDMNNTNWLISAEMARRALPEDFKQLVNTERYRAIQIYAVIKDRYWNRTLNDEDLETVKTNLKFPELMLFNFLLKDLDPRVSKDKNILLPMFESTEQLLGQYPVGFYQMIDIGAHENISDAVNWLRNDRSLDSVIINTPRDKFMPNANNFLRKKVGILLRILFQSNADRVIRVLKRGPIYIIKTTFKKCGLLFSGFFSREQNSLIHPVIKDEGPLQIMVRRGNDFCLISPALFDDFDFRNGDSLDIVPHSEAEKLLKTPEGNWHVVDSQGRGIRVPSLYELTEFKGYLMPEHLVRLTGAGSETFDVLGKGHIANYKKYMGLEPGMNFLEIACGMGRDAFQLVEILGKAGSYIGIDVQRESIVWLSKNITRDNPNFKFYHFDAIHELHNPYGLKTTMDCPLPAESRSIDRIGLQSLLTHIFEDEVVHYLKEIARVLKPGGIAYVTFLLYSEEIVSASRINDCTPYGLRFEYKYADGCYINNLQYPTGGVAYTEEAMMRMINRAGLKLTRPFLKGYWSGYHAQPDDDGQDVALLALAD